MRTGVWRSKGLVLAALVAVSLPFAARGQTALPRARIAPRLPVGAVQRIAPPGTASPTPGVDLTVTALSVDADCHVVATVRNAGSEPVPADVTPSLQFASGASAAGWALSGVGAPGASVSFRWPTFVVSGTVSVTATIDAALRVTEANEGNNSRTESLTCGAQLPDLSITATVDSNCVTTLEVRNVGEGPLFASSYQADSVRIARRIDEMEMVSLPLQTIDPGHALMNPGGTVRYTEPATFRAYDGYRYEVMYAWQQTSRSNDVASGSATGTCDANRPAFDVLPTNLALHSQCRMAVTLRSGGPGSVPPLRLSAQFFREGASVGSFLLPTPTAAGTTSSGIGPALPPGVSAHVRVVVDPLRQVPEGNESNNEISATLSCPG